MPELPDITLYLEALAPRVLNQPLERLRIANPFLLRTPDPPVSAIEGRTVIGLRRLGKRIVFELEGGLFLVLHLMIAGRLRWRERGARFPARWGSPRSTFRPARCAHRGGIEPAGVAAPRRARRSSLRLDPGGLEVLDVDLAAFAARLTRENHTLKRALTDPHLFSGIGNAYSDEILHAARLSPMKLTATLTEEEIARLHDGDVGTLESWIRRLRDEAGGGFPEKVTAFRDGMAVHGRYRQPCPVCGTPVQRIVYADNEANYCARCQTGGRLLADRALSRLLKEDWPKTLEELEQRLGRKGQ